MLLFSSNLTLKFQIRSSKSEAFIWHKSEDYNNIQFSKFETFHRNKWEFTNITFGSSSYGTEIKLGKSYFHIFLTKTT